MAAKQGSTATKRGPASVSAKVEDHLRRIARSDDKEIETMVGMRQGLKDITQLDNRSFALVKIAALIAVDAPPASYMWQIGNAIAEGVTPEEVLGTMWAVAPQVGGPRLISAAPEIMLALGLVLNEEDGEDWK
ncbi:MAG: carboxymuconolactone decarboxylase family protein [Chloroflexi bacterium]|nr:MAG: carboxymuconolactone decarboxylase family protein [Chloroflexota bacterium]TMF20702.1 MAG: carboxymuconolactone decarboxylase family protein [Chloroflexota bacterium]TMF52815.1 MAG: carboxymuconolactone decarboxylase family protein [Chloroflexota bacterium]TMG19397.1 MAG: carboxymuconolactone decarboxylase family protein [Chloroflexota bacterium]